MAALARSSTYPGTAREEIELKLTALFQEEDALREKALGPKLAKKEEVESIVRERDTAIKTVRMLHAMLTEAEEKVAMLEKEHVLLREKLKKIEVLSQKSD